MKRFVLLSSAILFSLPIASSCSRSNSRSEPGNTSDRADLASGGKVESEQSRSDSRVLRIPVRGVPESLDPAQGSSQYTSQICSLLYEPLLQQKYLVRPAALEPLLLAEMPIVSTDGLKYRFKLKRKVFFHNDPCFRGGKGRELVASDVIYSWKRLADEDVSTKNWWLLENMIRGFDAYRETQNAADTFDYNAPVSGLRLINDYEFEVTLTEAVQRFLWTLAMVQTSVVPREAVDKYGEDFAGHPIGTGSFIMAGSVADIISFAKNQTYHECRFPEEHMPEDATLGYDRPAGTRLPIVDRVVVTFFESANLMWANFRGGDIDISTVPIGEYDRVFDGQTRLRPEFQDAGIALHRLQLLDFIFYGFNMEDEVLGGYTEEKKYLRQAISSAIDWKERNDAFYSKHGVIYDGMIPPGLEGYPDGGIAPVNYRGLDLDRAKKLLAKAGYPNGEGLPAFHFYTSRAAPGPQMAEMTRRHLKRIGIRVIPHLDSFSSFMKIVQNGEAPFFSFAWGSDYPDAENNLALFYGPNSASGSNHFNYTNAEFDRLYERIRAMPPSDERTELIEQARDIVIEDAPFIGSLARTRFEVVQPRLKNYKPSRFNHNWAKYVDVDQSRK